MRAPEPQGEIAEGAIPSVGTTGDVDAELKLRTAERDSANAERDAAKRELARYKAAYETLLLAYEKLKKQIFGVKSERLTEAQLAFAWAKALEQAGTPELLGLAPPGSGMPPEPKGKRPSPKGRRSLKDADLPLETIVLLPPHLPEGAVRIGEDRSYRVEYRRAQLVKLCIERPVYRVVVGAVAEAMVRAERTVSSHVTPEEAVANKVEEAPPSPGEADTSATPREAQGPASGETCIVQAPPPDEMVPRGLLGHGLLAHLFVSKWVDHLPYHRQERMLARSGIDLDRSVMGRAEKACADLCAPIVEAARAYALAHAHVIATDATGTLVKQKEACKRGHFFVSIADEDFVFFDFKARHTQAAVGELFGGFTGYLQADASSVYDALFANKGGPTEAGCLAHARRKFFDALREDRDRALAALGLFAALFRIEKETEGFPPQKRLAHRHSLAGPVWNSLIAWCEKEDAARGKDRTLIGSAVRYLLRHKDALARFLEDGRIPLTNNRSENALRSVVLGRHNWLFVGSDEGAEQSAVFISLVASCKLLGLDPEAYLKDLFRVLPAWPASRVLELHPRFWARTRARLVEAEMAVPYGPITVPPKVPLPSLRESLEKEDRRAHPDPA
jgi:transposase